MRGRTIRTPEKEDEFLAVLATGASVGKSAAAIGISRRTAFDWKGTDAEFAACWDDAYETGTDLLEDEALRRSVHGTDKPVYYQGEVAGYIKEFSDTLLIVQLKARRKEKYAEKHDMNHTGNITVIAAKFGDGDG